MNTFGYQNKKNQNYFEGWYVRFTDDDKHTNVAIIFAITKDKDNPHSFIQYYDGKQQQAFYYTFQSDAFAYDDTTKTVSIGDNYLSLTNARVKTDDVDLVASMGNQTFLEPYHGHQSAMGYLAKAPLECFQEVIYLDSAVTFTLNGANYKGKSYMEKTYGTNFPKKWIWLQANHASNGSALTFSVGLVPVLFFHVKGFFLIYRKDGVEHRFGSYNFARIRIKEISETETTFTIKRGKTMIVLTAATQHPVRLVGPSKNGRMNLDVFESIEATASIRVYHKRELVFEDDYTNVGLELMY